MTTRTMRYEIEPWLFGRARIIYTDGIGAENQW